MGEAAIAAYPPTALAEKTSGQAVVTCERDASGKPQNCRITSETPAGLGFGAAALKLMNEAAPEGTMEPGRRLPLPFHFLFQPDPPVITPDVLHPERMTPYITHTPPAEESKNAITGMPLSGPGGSVVECWVSAMGQLGACKVVSETPPGSGWGPLEVKLLSLDRMGRFTIEGFPATGLKIRIDTTPVEPSASTSGK
jgi:TonB family protein